MWKRYETVKGARNRERRIRLWVLTSLAGALAKL